MRSNYKKLWKYIRQVNNRNRDLKISNLLWINIDKFFMPSVANIVWTDLSVYKIVSKWQFACNRMHVWRDMRLPVALSKNDEDFIVSPAYDVFEVIDEKELLPEYLMMWFSRKEFDRNAWFYTDTDVRQGLHWDAFINMELPVPDITKQQEIVDEYNAIKNRISLNNGLIEKLEETAKSIYKEWFVDFEFPDENWKPYKSSGGEMEFCSELEKDVPKGWKVENVKKIMNFVQWTEPWSESYSEIKLNNNYVQFYRVQDISTYWWNAKVFVDKHLLKNRFFKEKDILISLDWTIWKIFFWSEWWYSSWIRKIEWIYEYISNIFILCFLQSDYFYSIIDTSSWSETTIKHAWKMLDFMFICYEEKILKEFNEVANSIFDNLFFISKENKYLVEMKDLILSKMASES